MKNIFSVFLCLTLIMFLPCRAYCDGGIYSGSDDEFSEYASDFYGWDTASINASSWQGIDGDTHIPNTEGYQKEAFNDSVEAITAQLQDQGYSLDLWEGDAEPYSGSGNKGMVAAALAEVGVSRSYESPKGSNTVFYNEWFYGRSVSGSSYPWCCVFLIWCADSCGYVDSGLFPKTSSCGELYRHLTSSGGFSSFPVKSVSMCGGDYTPEPGDIVFWYESGSFIHAGIVTSSDSSALSVTQGDCSGCVATLSYSSKQLSSGSLGNGYIVHVVYPSFSFGSSGDIQDTVYLFLTMELSMSSGGACGCMGNFQIECGWDINAIGDSGTSYGLCQWHDSRWSALKSYCAANGLDSSTIEGQLRYLQYELTSTSEGAVLPYMQSAPSSRYGATSSSLTWAQMFERCTSSSYSMRSSAASSFWDIYGGN